MGHRRQARLKALCYLYQKYLVPDSVTCSPEAFMQHFEVEKFSRPYFLNIIDGVEDSLSEIDKELEEASDNWKLYRMNALDRCLLRVGVWELMKRTETAHKIIIDEAVELAKLYGTQDSPSFVNGILDRIAKKCRGLSDPVVSDAMAS